MHNMGRIFSSVFALRAMPLFRSPESAEEAEALL